MGKIKNILYPFVICFISGLLWGVIIGSISISTLVSIRMEYFYERIAFLESTITDKDEKLAKLEKSINNANIVLKDIVIVLEFENINQEKYDQLDSLEIEKSIKEKFRSLLGKEVKSLDAEILQQVIDKRILKFNDSQYQLTVNKLMLTDILKLWVKVSAFEVES